MNVFEMGIDQLMSYALLPDLDPEDFRKIFFMINHQRSYEIQFGKCTPEERARLYNEHVERVRIAKKSVDGIFENPQPSKSRSPYHGKRKRK